MLIRAEPIQAQKATGVTRTQAGLAIKPAKQKVSKCPEVPQIPSEVRGRGRKRTFPMIDGFVYF